jgi:hypothetical protein
MKKIALTALAFLASAAVFAEGFNLNGYLRAGYASEMGSHATQGTATWLAGDYFGGSTRSRLNVSWDNADGTAGAFVRLQYTGAIEDFSLSSFSVKYADAYAKVLDGKVVVAAGKLKDNYITSDGWEGFSVLDGKSGFFAALTPVAGLTVGGGAVVDYKGKESVVDYTPVYDLTGAVVGYTKSTTNSGYSYTDKNAVYGGFKYVNSAVTIDGGYAATGFAYGNIGITAVKNLTFQLEGAYETDDAADNGAYNNCEKTFCEQVEYTGVDKLTVAFVGYQYLNKHDSKITDDSNTTVTFTPAVSYALTKTLTARVEGTYTVYDYTGSPDNYGFVVPSLNIAADSSASVDIWGRFSSDADQTSNLIGVGVKKAF